MSMPLDEAIEIVVARSGHDRFKRLCDPDDPAFDPAYPPWVIAQAEASAAASTPGDGPGWLRKAANFTSAVVTHVASGMPVSDPSLAASRLAICHECDKLDAPRMVCTVCGCHVETKARWLDQHCPINKW